MTLPNLKDSTVTPETKNLTLSDKQLCDIELILDGSFKPLTGFLNKEDYQSVLDRMRLKNGDLWPIPICLDLDEETAKNFENLEKIELIDKEGFLIATMILDDIWKPDKDKEALSVFGTKDLKHPGVYQLYNNTKDYYVGGKLEKVALPTHHDFKDLRNTPRRVRELLSNLKNKNTIAFQTRNPIHRAHQELMVRAMNELGANILIHPVVGMTKPGDINHYTRVNCYKKILDYLPNKSTALSLIPLAMRMAGPKEAILHGLIRANYGCTHFIVGRDHAGPGLSSDKVPFYHEYEAQDLFIQFQDKINIQLVKFQNFVFLEDKAEYVPINPEIENNNNHVHPLVKYNREMILVSIGGLLLNLIGLFLFHED